MKTLVIHPKDETTDFLKSIYEGRGWSVINEICSTKHLKESIKSHDRIVMLGHGTPYGLIGFGGFLITPSLVYLLREKDCVCIWCNADKFVEKYELKGFYTGMIISEVMEANMYNINSIQSEVDNSNKMFAESIKNAKCSDSMLSEAKKNYTSDNCEIIKFNELNLYSTNS